MCSGRICVYFCGTVFVPIICFFTLLYGLSLMSQKTGYWRCKKCETRFDRKIRWYDFG